MDEELINKIVKKLDILEERLVAIEKEQRMIREDILSGDPKGRMQRRLLENRPEKLQEKKKKIDENIKIEI
jgi:hypothetical protein